MFALFAQGARNLNNDAAGAGFLMMFLTIVLVAVGIGIAIQIFYCLTLSKALKEVHPELRELEPGQVWLLFIPFFNLYWLFVVASKVPNSLKAEFRDRGMGKSGDDYGANIGKWYCICTIASIIPFVGSFIGLAGFILWIMFWVRIAGYGKQLREDDGGGDDFDDRPRKKKARDDDYDDDEDDAPRQKKKRRDDDD